LHKYAIKNVHTLPVCALNFEILKFSAAPETHFKSILMLGGRGKFNICGLDHFDSEPFILFTEWKLSLPSHTRSSCSWSWNYLATTF